MRLVAPEHLASACPHMRMFCAALGAELLPRDYLTLALHSSVFLLLTWFAKGGCSWAAGLGQGLGGGSPIPWEGTESEMQIIVGERGKTS